tara:strand:+ start:372 stop:623 length:252 start_codon:yes stop_codon:yes gene_type:complete
MRTINMDNIDLDRIIEMCWEDRTPFEALEYQFGIKEEDAIKIMRRNLKPNTFKVWRKRVAGRNTKHMMLQNSTRFKSIHKRKL